MRREVVRRYSADQSSSTVQVTALLPAATLVVALLCGGGGGGGNAGTPPGTYQLAVTGAYSVGTSTLEHNLHVKLTVK